MRKIKIPSLQHTLTVTLATGGLLFFTACFGGPFDNDAQRRYHDHSGTSADTGGSGDGDDNQNGGEGEGEGEGEQQQCPAVGGISYVRPAPNVMFLVDRSGSMAEPDACDDATCPSKWSQLLGLGGYLNAVKQHARLGLSVFPSVGESGCSVSSGVMVPLTGATDVDTRILETVSSIVPEGRTPIAEALDEVAASGGLDDPERDNIVVLLTDGMPNCACEGDEDCERAQAVAAVERLTSRAQPIRPYIVGFGAGAAAAGDTLSAMAQAAGTAIAGPVSYYQADNVEALVTRLYQLAADLAPCRFNLDEWPASTDLKVWLDDALVAPCTDAACTSGYTYDASAGVVELHGSSCEAIRDGACHSVWFDTAASE